jgi:hypothetical protein
MAISSMTRLFYLGSVGLLIFFGVVSWSKLVLNSTSIYSSLKTHMDGGAQYVLVIDAGSSGTRMNAFKFYSDAGGNSRKEKAGVRGNILRGAESIVVIPPDAAKDKIPKRSTEKNRAYKRVETEPGLSDWNEEQVRMSLEPLLDWARAVVPKHVWSDTPIFLFGTAGMRRLGQERQEKILESCRGVLGRSGFRFLPSSVRVIDGIKEGIYGWSALNAIEGRLGGDETLGSLDLGGSSLEITYSVPSAVQGSTPVTLGGTTYNVYTFSLSHAGLDDAFQRSIQMLEGGMDDDMVVKHPCIHSGYRQTIKRIPLDGVRPTFPEVEVIGAPDDAECDNLAEQVVANMTHCDAQQVSDATKCTLSSEHPKFQGRFAAMSGFYVVNHFYGLTSSSSIDDVRLKTDSFCALDWEKVGARHAGELAVETYCFRGEYVEALLSGGLQLSSENLILGYESPGWPLGAALVEGLSPNVQSRSDEPTNVMIESTKIKSLFLVVGSMCCMLLVYLAAKLRQQSLLVKVSRKVATLRSRRSFASKTELSSRSRSNMEQGIASSSLWRQSSRSGISSGSLSRSQTFRKLNSLDTDVR